MGLGIDLSPLQAIFFVLACWFWLGIGVLIGHFTWPRGTDTPAPPEPVSTAPEPPVYTHPRGAHHGPPTVQFELPVLAAPEPTPPTPHRRAEDLPGVPPAPPRPGGRRRSDSPPLTRRQARELRERGWYEEDPASRS